MHTVISLFHRPVTCDASGASAVHGVRQEGNLQNSRTHIGVPRYPPQCPRINCPAQVSGPRRRVKTISSHKVRSRSCMSCSYKMSAPAQNDTLGFLARSISRHHLARLLSSITHYRNSDLQQTRAGASMQNNLSVRERFFRKASSPVNESAGKLLHFEESVEVWMMPVRHILIAEGVCLVSAQHTARSAAGRHGGRRCRGRWRRRGRRR